jgi:Domain of unknown function (DUF4157)
MNCSACSRSPDAVQGYGRVRRTGGPARAALGTVFLLMFVLVLSVSASATWARESGGAKTAGSGGDAKAMAIADAGRFFPDLAPPDLALPPDLAPRNLNRIDLDHINRFIAILDEHNRDALQRMELQLRQNAAIHGGPILERWIIASRDEALREGVASIPPEMRVMLIGFFPEALLDRVRYRIGWGSKASLQGYVFGVGDTRGITLGEVIVFRDAETAADPLIWAHELVHVQQYDRWGTREFADRYIRSFKEVEDEAWRAQGRYKSWAQRTGLMARTDPATMWKR